MLGFFGKMPSNGDFLSKGFSPALVDGLDHLFQAALSTAAAEASDPKAMFEAAPPLMLNIRAGALSPCGFTGIVVPSCDRVGRVFPLCAGAEIPPGGPSLPLVWPSRSLAVALLRIVRAAFERGEGADGLDRSLNDLTDWGTLASDTAPFALSNDETIPRLAVDGSHYWYEGPNDRMSALEVACCNRLAWVAELLGVTLSPNGDASSYFASRSLLSWSHMAAIFDGRWEFWGWSSYFLAAGAAANNATSQESPIDVDATRPPPSAR